MSDSFNCEKHGARDQRIVVCHKSALFLLQPIPKDTLVIRTYIHQMHLHFISREFWWEYDLWNQNFVQKLPFEPYAAQLATSLNTECLQRIMDHYQLTKLVLVDDHYEDREEVYPAMAYVEHLGLLEGMQQ